MFEQSEPRHQATAICVQCANQKPSATSCAFWERCNLPILHPRVVLRDPCVHPGPPVARVSRYGGSFSYESPSLQAWSSGLGECLSSLVKPVLQSEAHDFISPPLQQSFSLTDLTESSAASFDPRHRCVSEPEALHTKIGYVTPVSAYTDIAQPLLEPALCGCGKGPTLASDPSFEVQDFVKACGRVIALGGDEEVQVGMHQVCNFCPKCILRWHAMQRQAASKGLNRLAFEVSGPRFFRDVSDGDLGQLHTGRGALDNDIQDCCESVSLVVSRANFHSVADDGAVSGVPSLRNCISRRTRRRRNRRARLDALIQPPGFPRGAPRTQEEEVFSRWRCKRQEEVGPLTRGPGGPHRLDSNICRPNPCHSSLHGDPNPNLHVLPLGSNPGVRPDGCTRKSDSSNLLCNPSLCLPSRKGSPNPNLAVLPEFAGKMARVACGFPEFSSFPGHFPGRETNPHFGAQNGTLSGSPSDNAAAVPGKHHTPPDLSQKGGAGKDLQKELLLELKQAVLSGVSAPLLDIVEKMEQQGAITEGTFGWKAAELAVETQEDVPKHVARVGH